MVEELGLIATFVSFSLNVCKGQLGHTRRSDGSWTTGQAAVYTKDGAKSKKTKHNPGPEEKRLALESAEKGFGESRYKLRGIFRSKGEFKGKCRGYKNGGEACSSNVGDPIEVGKNLKGY